ncbi:DUF3857 domain-containing protein [Flavobacterium sp.]|uniref:DUF3857 domain-containing protein n=1 Tax=Flavobacterium sp. TaxID=239 RepID=UPI0025C08512|nr:DUF3857 domain-containing protein [Flavobacterium sp.]
MNWLTLNKTAFFAVVGVVALQAKMQAQVLSVDDYKKKWTDANELILSDKSSYDIFIEDKKLRIIRDNYYESIILSENGILNNQESFSYSELVKLREYDAFSIVSDKGKERKIKVTQSNEKLSRSSSIFHDGVKERQLIFPNLQKGARKVYNVQTEFVDPYLLQSFVFGNSLPMVNSTLEVRTDKDINIGYRVFNDPTNSITFAKTEKKGKWIYTWTLTDVKAIKFESNNPGFRHVVPHIDVFVKDYVSSGAKIDVLDDTNKLYTYYKSFLKNLNKTENADLKALSNEITTGASNDEEKVKKIFYWVKDNIKYIAFENGYEGFIPREASLVYERKFGDCKDMANLISSMSAYAGIKGVSVCWIGTREIPYSYKELSTPAVDNHMIAVFKDNGKYTFLDATDRETRFGIPTSFIQGKEALVSNGEQYEIVEVPIVASDDNGTVEKIRLTLDKDKLLGSATVDYSGFSRSHYLSQIGDASGKMRFDLIKSLVLKGNNKFNLKDFKEANIGDRDKPYKVDYTFDLADYAIPVDKEIYVSLFLDQMFDKVTMEPDRVSAFEFDFLTSYKGEFTLELPKDTSVKFLPPNFKLDNSLLSVDCKYVSKPTEVSLIVNIKLKKMLLQKADFDLWNDTVKQLKDAYSQTLILASK